MLKDFDSLFKLSGKTAIVTGGAKGLGRSIAEALAWAGACVAIADIDIEEARLVAAEICEQGGDAFAFYCNVSEQSSVHKLIYDVVETYGSLDIIISNAGFGDRSPAEKMEEVQWDRVMEINLKGVWICNQEAGKYFIEHEIAGCIINMASVTGLVGITTGNANYASAKAGVMGLTRTLAVEWGKYGIRVNALAPAQVQTPLLDKLMEEQPSVYDYFIQRIPLGRLGNPIDIAGPALFLSSPAASWMTGHTLIVDGGNTIMY